MPRISTCLFTAGRRRSAAFKHALRAGGRQISSTLNQPRVGCVVGGDRDGLVVRLDLKHRKEEMAHDRAVGGMCLQIVCCKEPRAVCLYAGLLFEFPQRGFRGRLAGFGPSSRKAYMSADGGLRRSTRRNRSPRCRMAEDAAFEWKSWGSASIGGGCAWRNRSFRRILSSAIRRSFRDLYHLCRCSCFRDCRLLCILGAGCKWQSLPGKARAGMVSLALFAWLLRCARRGPAHLPLWRHHIVASLTWLWIMKPRARTAGTSAARSPASAALQSYCLLRVAECALTIADTECKDIPMCGRYALTISPKNSRKSWGSWISRIFPRVTTLPRPSPSWSSSPMKRGERRQSSRAARGARALGLYARLGKGSEAISAP